MKLNLLYYLSFPDFCAYKYFTNSIFFFFDSAKEFLPFILRFYPSSLKFASSMIYENELNLLNYNGAKSSAIKNYLGNNFAAKTAKSN